MSVALAMINVGASCYGRSVPSIGVDHGMWIGML